MAALSATAARHIDQHLAETEMVRAALSGGIWSSPAARSAFTTALHRASGLPLTVTKSPADAVAGAVRLAASFAP